MNLVCSTTLKIAMARGPFSPLVVATLANLEYSRHLYNGKLMVMGVHKPVNYNWGLEKMPTAFFRISHSFSKLATCLRKLANSDSCSESCSTPSPGKLAFVSDAICLCHRWMMDSPIFNSRVR